MPSVSLLLWVFTRALLLPHEPYVASLATPGDYPASGSVDGLIETAVPAVLSDRFDASGTGVGRPALLGAYGGSFTDTTFRIGDLDVTSPLRPGTPLVLPDTVGFDSVAITEAPSLTAESAPGVRVAVTPRRPAARPTMAIEAALAPPRWTATASDPPAVAALGSAGDASVVWSGPLRGDRLGAVVGAHWTRARSTVRGRSEPAASLASAMAHIVAKGRHDDEWRTLLTIQHADHASALWLLQTTPLIAHDRMGLAHLTWARDVAGRLGWTVSAGYQRAFIDPATASGVTRVDSVLDGSILPMMLDPAGRTDALRVAADVRGAVSDQTRHAWRVGGSIDAAWIRPDSAAGARRR